MALKFEQKRKDVMTREMMSEVNEFDTSEKSEFIEELLTHTDHEVVGEMLNRHGIVVNINGKVEK